MHEYLLGETLRALALRAHRKGFELACHIQPELPDALIGDAGRLDDGASTLDGLAEMVGQLGPLLEELSIEQLRRQADAGEPA